MVQESQDGGCGFRQADAGDNWHSLGGEGKERLSCIINKLLNNTDSIGMTQMGIFDC
jgi:hypothetical protein